MIWEVYILLKHIKRTWKVMYFIEKRGYTFMKKKTTPHIKNR